jgi:alanyl-tRNA synthetase
MVKKFFTSETMHPVSYIWNLIKNICFIDLFVNEKGQGNDLYSAELCCGTHAKNTGQLSNICLTSFKVVGDSTFELDGCVSDYAVTTARNDQILLSKLSKMAELRQLVNSGEKTAKAGHELLNEIATVSIQLEKVFAKQPSSCVTARRVTEESVKYRPSKNQLQIMLKKYIEDELRKEKQRATERVFIQLDSGLIVDDALNLVKKLNVELLPRELILLNRQRGVIYLHSAVESDSSSDYFDSIQKKLGDVEAAESKQTRAIRSIPGSKFDEIVSNPKDFFSL